MKNIYLLLILFLDLIGLYEAHFERKPTVLLISFDGFRWDYMEKFQTPNLHRLVINGVKAKYLENTFVTKTFPNHYTIVTGLFEESHGIVSNSMYDPVFKAFFHIGNNQSRWWNGGEPLWVTNQNAGGTSATIFWPGSEVKIRGQYPTYFMKYNSHLSYKARVDRMIELLSKEDPPNFLTMYFEEPDHSGHEFGPDSTQVRSAVQKADNITGYMLTRLESKRLLNKINIIVTSDHGMTSISSNRTIYLSDYIPSSMIYMTIPLTWDAFIFIYPKKQQTENVYTALKKAQHITVYKKEEIPVEYHYKNNRRIPPILAVADLGWSIAVNRSVKFTNRGNHGYSNKHNDMHPFFIAQGPAFKKGYISEPFKNVDIYPLICHILSIEPAPNNGSLARVLDLLSSSSSNVGNYTLLFFISGLSIAVFILMSYGIISFCIKQRSKNNYGHIYDLGPDI